jgi:hypothetical protein
MLPVIDDGDSNHEPDYEYGANINKREERYLEVDDEYLYRDEFADDCED